MLRKAVLLFCLLTVWSLMASARHLSGQVVDAKTGESLPGVTVELLDPGDSSVVRTAVTVDKTLFGITFSGYDIDVDNHRSYILRFSMVGYKTVCRRVEVKMAERVNEQQVDDVRMEEDARLLDEVVVKATKVKMVMHGDTVVYDASAFNLSQGSMLDALIRQMPGTTLEDGVIKVNGRTVSSLLVDGRDFFKGDAKKALENLPAYTVDKVKAYDKRGKESRLMGRDMDDREFVLDVGLKKQYQHGMMGNVDLAGGSDHRYSSKLFSMLYDRHSRLTLIGSANNISDTSTPGDGTMMQSTPDLGGGLTATKMAGAAYRYEGKTEDDFVETEATMTHSDNEILTRTSSQVFLTGGDYYGLSRNGNRAKNTSLSWNGMFGLHAGRHMLDGKLGVEHTRNRGWGSSLSGRFNANPGTTALLDSLFAPDAGRRLLATTINRVRNDNMYHGQSTAYSATLSDRFRFGGDEAWDNMLHVDGSFLYNTVQNECHALNHIDYMGSSPTQDHRRQYSETPNKNYDLSLTADYTRLVKCDSDEVTTLFVRPAYRFNQRYSSLDNTLYRLDQLHDFTDEAYTLGVLPSTREALLAVLDAHNSDRSREHTMSHSASLTANLVHGDGTRMPRWAAGLSLPLELHHEQLDYYRQQRYDKSRTSLFFSPTLSLSYQLNDSTGTRYVSLSYRTSQSQPSLTSMLDIRDDANPLVITLGNPGLRKARTHSIDFNASLFQMGSQRFMSFGLNYSVTQNAIATSTLYDKATGKTTTQQVNVDGNWNLGGSLAVGGPLDRMKRLTLQQYFTAQYNNSVDLTTVEGTQAARSDVHSWNINDQMALEYQLGEKLSLKAGVSASYQRATGNRVGFQTVNAWNYTFGLGGMVALPWGLQCSTDLAHYNRRGYNDPEMNTSELVWNARLSKKLLSDRLVFSLDGFDILGNLSNTTFTLNEQGRTETWTNSVSRYLMAHVAYKFTLGMKAPH